MRGNHNERLFDKMHETFVCLLAGAIKDCLREYYLGDMLKTNLIEFKYETAASK